MAQTAADVLVEGIIDWGVDTVFGLPGDGINGIMEALRQRQDRVRFIQVRHEEAAAFMACAYAKYTGRLGCCLATSGPGGIHLLNGLYDAKLDQAPVLAITGQIYSDLKGSNFQQEINMTLLFEDVTVYNQEVINPEQVAMLTDAACRHALNHRGVAHITFPVDYQEKEPTGRGSMHKVEGHTTSRWSSRWSKRRGPPGLTTARPRRSVKSTCVRCPGPNGVIIPSLQVMTFTKSPFHSNEC